jgi:hypothetical protein
VVEKWSKFMVKVKDKKRQAVEEYRVVRNRGFLIFKKVG